MNGQIEQTTVGRKDNFNEGMEIDLQRIWRAVWNKVWVVILACIISTSLAFAGTWYLITPEYQSSALFYVNNNNLSLGDVSVGITSSDISASKSLVDTYVVILNTRSSINMVIDYAEVDRSYTELKEMISASAVNDTEIFEVVVTSPDPQEAEKIANAIAEILPKRISSIVEGSSSKVVDYAVIPSQPSSPSYINNMMLGFLVGLMLSVLGIALAEIADVTIKSEEDIEHCCTYPILASVPDMEVPTKGGYYRKRNEGKYMTPSPKTPRLIGNDISFTASEAYKLLRTKLQFSFADDKKSRVFVISSTLAGEGKSLTAINLAHAMAQLDKRVLLIDCDMRRPTLAEKLSMHKLPGLANYLAGHVDLPDVIQHKQLKGLNLPLDIVAAGNNPPNPIELLSSGKMKRMLEMLKESYDYIILDLPPVGEVSDAMVAAKLADGVLLVARQNYCDRRAFRDVVSQFEFIQARILGIMINCATEHGAGYGGKYKYYKYGKYKRYYRYSKYNRYSKYSRYNDSAATKNEQRQKP